MHAVAVLCNLVSGAESAEEPNHRDFALRTADKGRFHVRVFFAPPTLLLRFFYSGAEKRKKKIGAAGADRYPGRDWEGKGRAWKEEEGV